MRRFADRNEYSMNPSTVSIAATRNPTVRMPKMPVRPGSSRRRSAVSRASVARLTRKSLSRNWSTISRHGTSGSVFAQTSYGVSPT
ncbi:MAG: hypothetical protein EBV53_14485 [Proteobacteria bacterium]|nr:hypothetical protein [Pseudomonadota bacterium]